ncbi:TPA: hypothetical protein ACGUTO_004331 [Vibrio vulnificus]
MNKSRFVLFAGLLFQKSISLLNVSSAALSFQKSFSVLLVRFLRRCAFQVVSVTNALKLRLIRVFQNTQRQCWQSGNQFQIKALGLATNKAFKRDSQRLAVLV